MRNIMSKEFKTVSFNGEVPIPSIGDNGNWYVGKDDTDVKAQGEQGIQGPKGDVGPIGPAGSFANMELVFDGNAAVIDQAYQLLNPITNYKVIIAEISAFYDQPNGGWIKRYELIINPVVSSINAQYGHIFSNFGLERCSIWWKFPTATTMNINALDSISILRDIKIVKIYGIK